jgi:general secretion pathway protein L
VIGSAAREFWDWWLSQLRELVPGTHGDATSRRRAVLVVASNRSNEGAPASITARIERRGRAERLGKIALNPDGLRALKRTASSLGRTFQTLLEVPSSQVLEKKLVLPAAAERELDQVLVLAMDRETPFAADEVYWDGRVEERDRAKRLITVRLSMVAKAQFADLVAALTQAALAPTALISGRNRRIVIALDHGSASRRHAVTMALALLCAVLAIAAIAVPFAQQSIALGRVDDQIDSLRPAVDAVERVRQRAANDRKQVEALAAQRAAFGDPLAMLAAVTAAIPDDTWLNSLEYSQGKLRISGQSKAASHLIGDMSKGTVFKNPEFAAPVTRAEDGKVDVFTISAEMRN